MGRAPALPARSMYEPDRRGWPVGGVGRGGGGGLIRRRGLRPPRTPPADVDMERLVFIVSQERRELFESLKRVLASERAVDIILDRRVVKRRHREEPPAAERRRFARRPKAPENAEINARCWTVVRFP